MGTPCVGLISVIEDSQALEASWGRTFCQRVTGCAFDLTPSSSYDEQVPVGSNKDDPKTMGEESEPLRCVFFSILLMVFDTTSYWQSHEICFTKPCFLREAGNVGAHRFVQLKQADKTPAGVDEGATGRVSFTGISTLGTLWLKHT